MRLKDLSTDVAYATCDGKYVKVLDVTLADYVVAYKRDPENLSKFLSAPSGSRQRYATEVVPYEKRDPWGPCHPGVLNQERDASYPKGLKVALYEDIDRDGVPIDGVEPVITKVRQADVKGTWTEYLVLHGEVVRKNADWRTSMEEARARYRSLDERLDAISDALQKKLGGLDCVRITTYINEQRVYNTDNAPTGVFDFSLSVQDNNPIHEVTVTSKAGSERTSKLSGFDTEQLEQVLGGLEKLVGIKPARKSKKSGARRG